MQGSRQRYAHRDVGQPVAVVLASSRYVAEDLAEQVSLDIEPLEAVNPIWEPLDSVVLAPSAEQRHRERIEPIKKHRQLLDASLIHPYAVCETPAFIA